MPHRLCRWKAHACHDENTCGETVQGPASSLGSARARACQLRTHIDPARSPTCRNAGARTRTE
eukprot:8454696-Alexandrium_andersonii.AAC.1